MPHRTHTKRRTTHGGTTHRGTSHRGTTHRGTHRTGTMTSTRKRRDKKNKRVPTAADYRRDWF
jgi:hypothetical protein